MARLFQSERRRQAGARCIVVGPGPTSEGVTDAPRRRRPVRPWPDTEEYSPATVGTAVRPRSAAHLRRDDWLRQRVSEAPDFERFGVSGILVEDPRTPEASAASARWRSRNCGVCAWTSHGGGKRSKSGGTPDGCGGIFPLRSNGFLPLERALAPPIHDWRGNWRVDPPALPDRGETGDFYTFTYTYAECVAYYRFKSTSSDNCSPTTNLRVGRSNRSGRAISFQ